MISLPKEQFWKAEKPLEAVPFNTLFASTVVDNVLSGRIYVDNVQNPTAFLVAHPYGMSLLFGKTDNAGFNNSLREYMADAEGTRKAMEWLQVHPAGWKPVIEELLGADLVRKECPAEMPSPASDDPGRVMEYTRVNFLFDRDRYNAFAGQCPAPPGSIVRTDAKLFHDIQGQVIPRHFWRDTDHFLGEGVGFTLMAEGRAASTAFCAFMKDNMLEIGIETSPEFRGKGYAIHVCKAMIDHCLENGYEPIWSCRLENTGSFSLARKLGFEPVLYLPYYQLASRP
jgi:GNAT superfamily N-acetyltransferase